MKHTCIPALLAISLLGCSNEQQSVDNASTSTVDVEQPVAVETPSSPHDSSPTAAASTGLSGAVLETMDSGGYTYVLLDVNGDSVWVAGPQATVAVGDVVAVEGPMAMPNFHSSTLNRDFEMIYFAAGISGGKPKVAKAPSPLVEGSPTVEKAEGGMTVAEIFSKSADFNGKEVVLRAKVVKYTPDIMGKNWLHVQDGSGAEGTNDLTITTAQAAAMGDTVLIRGTLATDKDFGYGYLYDVIVEEAQLTIE